MWLTAIVGMATKFYCIDNKLPPLTSIVVGAGRGTPGKDIPVDLEDIDKQREKVYVEDWYDIYLPTAEELLKSYKSAHGLE